MKNLFICFLLLSVMLISVLANAAKGTLDWLPPTSNNDGSLIVGSLTYNAYYSSTAGVACKTATPVPITNVRLLGNIDTRMIADWDMPSLSAGTYYFTLTATSSVGEGVCSAESNPVIIVTIPIAIPSAPTGVSVEVN